MLHASQHSGAGIALKGRIPTFKPKIRLWDDYARCRLLYKSCMGTSVERTVAVRGRARVVFGLVAGALGLISAFMLFILIFVDSELRPVDDQTIAVMLGSVLALQALLHIVAFKRRIASDEKEKCLLDHQIEAQAESLQRLQRDGEEQKRMRHDLRQHMRTIAELADQGRIEALRTYVGATSATVIRTPASQLTANVQLDALLCHYQADACGKSVAFLSDVRLPDNLGIPVVQLNMILGNLLENAIDAAAECATRESTQSSFVRIGAQMKNSTVVITIENSYAGDVWEVAGVFASTKHAGTGVGIPSSRKTADRLGGLMTCSYHDGRFRATVSIPTNRPSVPCVTPQWESPALARLS